MTINHQEIAPSEGSIPTPDLSFSTSNGDRKKFGKYKWRINDNGSPKHIRMQDMDTAHLLKAAKYAEKQSILHMQKMDLFVCKYEELIHVLAERGILEEELAK